MNKSRDEILLSMIKTIACDSAICYHSFDEHATPKDAERDFQNSYPNLFGVESD